MPDPGVASLLCRITPSAFGALPLAYVREIMRPLPIAPTASRVVGVRGETMIRGIATPVIEAALLLGASVRPNRLVSLTSGARQVALAVEDVLGIIDVPRQPGGGIALFDARVAPLATIDPGLPALLLTMQRVASEHVPMPAPGAPR